MTTVSPQASTSPTPPAHSCGRCVKAAKRRAERSRQRDQARARRHLRFVRRADRLRHSCHPGSPARIRAARWMRRFLISAANGLILALMALLVAKIFS